MTLRNTIAIVNPNSSVHVTDGIAQAVLRAHGASEPFTFLTLHDGPPGIVTQADVELASSRVRAWAASSADRYGAVVVACFSDPGVAEAQAASATPVIGLGEAGLRQAAARGERVGVIAVASVAIERHMRRWQRLGLAAHVAGERGLDVSVQASGDPEVAWHPMLKAAQRLIGEDGADVLLLGCAGMAGLAARLEDTVGCPVVEPCAAAASAALALATDVRPA
ncbi:Asp/Glu racemase [Verticiella sediminum]|uniref:Asp/Glu racemase n=1 Tax=Verticiella sediminum TaxID=1247510 RepID=A0A556AGZ7_9BURK|nr:aspartate/glutamate racemase family protein [Verticiella sediminum]TSH92143.1 Asp/Glu racemase [Verticiella sediminum]